MPRIPCWPCFHWLPCARLTPAQARNYDWLYCFKTTRCNGKNDKLELDSSQNNSVIVFVARYPYHQLVWENARSSVSRQSSWEPATRIIQAMTTPVWRTTQCSTPLPITSPHPWGERQDICTYTVLVPWLSTHLLCGVYFVYLYCLCNISLPKGESRLVEHIVVKVKQWEGLLVTIPVSSPSPFVEEFDPVSYCMNAEDILNACPFE
jgi:hypothetical protein